MTTFPPKSPCPRCGADLTISAAPPVQMEAVAGDLIIKRPLRYEPEGHVGGPAIKDADGQLVAALYWPGHEPAETDRAVGELHLLASSFVDAGNATDPDNADVYEIGKRDGFEDAVQTIDMRTGGDGEFYGSTIPGRGQDVPSMLDGIVERFNAASPVPSPVQQEAVAWRVGVPNNEYATLHEDVAEIARKHGYEVTPLYASPVPSSERDDIIEMCAKVAEAFSEVSARAGGGLASEASAACSAAVASSIRSLKSQPAQESGEGSE